MAELLDFKSVKDVPPGQILARSDDGRTVVMLDGLKVSDKLIAQAQTEAKARVEADRAAKSSGVDLDDPDFIAKVEAIATAAAQKVINAANAKK